jgi:hypothetical protein
VIKKKKHPLLLLEVLVAIALVSLIAVPLLYPQMYLLKAQNRFVEKLELDRMISLLFAKLIVDLYENKIPFSQIESSMPQPIDSKMIQDAGYKGRELPFTGTYRFEKVINKPNPPKDFTVYLYELIFTFTSKDKEDEKQEPLTITYQVVLARKLKTEAK